MKKVDAQVEAELQGLSQITKDWFDNLLFSCDKRLRNVLEDNLLRREQGCALILKEIIDIIKGAN